METIKERADTAIYKPKDGHAPVKAYEVIAYADGYERGATEQKDATLFKIYNIITEQMGKACGTALIKEIQKAMEE